MDVCFVALWMNHLNIVAEGCFETLLNNRPLLKGITFAKMYDTSRQEPFCIKITWLINLTDVIFTQVQQDCGRNFFVAKSYACNKRKEECIVRYTQQREIFLLQNLTNVIFWRYSVHCYENKTRSKKLNLDNKCFQQLWKHHYKAVTVLAAGSKILIVFKKC